MNVPVFSNSDESFAAEDLLNAYQSGDGAQIKKLITPNRYGDMQDDWCSQRDDEVVKLPSVQL